MTTLNEINELANDVLVNRELIKYYEDKMQAIIDNNPELQALQSDIEQAKREKDQYQAMLIEAMKSNELKSWKTEKCNFARSRRVSVSPNPLYKKEVEKKMKLGEQVEGWEMKESEYLSVRITK